MTKRKNVFRLFTVLCALFSLTLVACDEGGSGDKPKDNGDIELSITTSETTVEVGETLQLEYNVSPSDATVTFKSSDPDIAAVSAISGLVTGNSEGVTIITATASCSGYNNATASVDITVTEAMEEGGEGEGTVSITLSASTTTIKVGEYVNVSATCNPSSAKVSYSSSDESIATITSAGRVTGVSEGVATITATATRSGYKDGVATLEITVESAYDAAYVIAGDFEGDSWTSNPTNNNYILGYDSADSSSMYWEVDIVVSTEPDFGEYEPWDAGFVIVQYSATGDWTFVAGFDALDLTKSSGVETWTDNNNNIKLTSWNMTYTVVIDFRDSNNWSIVVTPFTGAEGELKFADNFAMGMDFSSIIEVENAGGDFYDYNGNKIDDPIAFLAENGVNYARIRLWNNPSDDSGNSYCGGGNNLETDLKIAQRAVAAGMKICLDFHYSDFWAHHGQQYAPKEWQNYNASEKASAGAEWTTTVLNAFAEAGCSPSMVQVGNETNNNEICGLSNSNGAIAFFKSCCDAVRAFDSSIQIVIHYADDQNASTYKTYYDALINGGCDFDICGLSFYPFWHENGSLSSFKSTITTLQGYYPNKKVCLMEYSYAWTTDWAYVASTTGDRAGDGGGVMNNSFWTTEETYAGYPATETGMAQCIYDIHQILADTGVIGSFYWEPAWIAVDGSSWASNHSSSYYTLNGKTESGFDTCTWANQAFFNYSHKAISSLKVYNYMLGNE